MSPLCESPIKLVDLATTIHAQEMSPIAIQSSPIIEDCESILLATTTSTSTSTSSTDTIQNVIMTSQQHLVSPVPQPTKLPLVNCDQPLQVKELDDSASCTIFSLLPTDLVVTGLAETNSQTSSSFDSSPCFRAKTIPSLPMFFGKRMCKVTVEGDIASSSERESKRPRTDSFCQFITLFDTACAKSTTAVEASKQTKQQRCTKTTSKACFKTLPDDLVCQVGSFLNVKSLNDARLTCRRFASLLKGDQAGWVENCNRLWSRKAHILPLAREVVVQPQPQQAQAESTEKKCSALPFNPLSHVTNANGISACVLKLSNAFDAYRLSCLDAHCRQELRRDDELLYNPETGTGTVWSFRFKHTAGREWTNQDPWHHGRPATNLVFLQDGTVRELVAAPMSSSSSSSSSSSDEYDDSDYDGDEHDESKRQYELVLPFSGSETLWRFVQQPLDLPRRMDGAYIRLTVGGRDVPTYLVKRSPTGNWGFVLENCWSVFASFPIKQQQQQEEVHSILSDDVREVSSLLRGAAPSHLDPVSLSDATLSVSSTVQWREALLYNLGASILPDATATQFSFGHHASGA